MSSHTLRESLSRSSSLFEEEQAKSYTELEALADAMAHEEHPPCDSQGLDFREAGWDFREEETKSDSEVEVVGAKEAPATPAPSHATQREQLSVLLDLVKVKMGQRGVKSHAPSFAISISLFLFFRFSYVPQSPKLLA